MDLSSSGYGVYGKEDRLPGSGEATEDPGTFRPMPVAHELRERLREFTVAIRPGETLVVLAHPGWTSSQMAELQMMADVMASQEGLPFKILFVPGAQLGLVSDEVPEVPGAAKTG